MIYTVTAVVQSLNLDDNEPCPVQWYKGDNLAKAIVSMSQAAAHDIDVDHGDLPKSMRYRTLDVHLNIEEKEGAPWL